MQNNSKNSNLDLFSCKEVPFKSWMDVPSDSVIFISRCHNVSRQGHAVLPGWVWKRQHLELQPGTEIIVGLLAFARLVPPTNWFDLQ